MIDAPAKLCHRLLAPRIGYLIGTIGSEGPDIAPISNVTQASSTPQIFVTAVFRKWRTYANIRDSGGFVLSVPRVEHADVVWRLGARFSGYVIPPDAGKLSASGGGFDTQSSRYGPILSGATGWCECELITEVDLPESDHGIFLSRVLRGEFNEQFMRPDGTYIQNSRPIMQVVLNTFATSSDHWEIPWLGTDHA
jgi:flavin reductase (DIM6/NTAB) family NADH-FMN oxidoreductase RutF